MSLDDNANQPPLRLTRLYIEELFGPGSTPIDIRFKLQERVTVLAPPGYRVLKAEAEHAARP